MPKFVPVVGDNEKTLSERIKQEEAIASERKSDRGWKTGEVGWGVVRSFGDDEKDTGAQVAKHAEGDNKMVKNEKGLWVKVKSAKPAVRETERTAREDSRDRAKGKERNENEEPRGGRERDQRRRSPSRSVSSDRRSVSPSRDRARDRERRSDKTRRRSPSRSYDRSRDRDRERDRDNRRKDDRHFERPRERSRDRDRDRDRRRERERSKSADRKRSRRDRSDSRRRERESDRRNSRRSPSRSRSHSHSPSPRGRGRGRGRNTSHSRSHSPVRKNTNTREQPRRREDEPRTADKHKTTQKEEKEKQGQEDEFAVTAIQVVNRFQEVFSDAKLSATARLQELDELFAAECSIKNLKSKKTYYSGREQIRNAFQDTVAAPVTVSKRVYLEAPSKDKHLPTVCCDLHRKNLVPGLGDREKENVLVYACRDAKIVSVWGGVDKECLADNDKLQEKQFFESNMWQQIVSVVSELWALDKDVVRKSAHFHDYDHMEVWG